MAKSIYFTLLLLVVCLIYEAYGEVHRYKHISPSHSSFKRKNGPYYSSTSSTIAADEENRTVEDAALSSEPARMPLFSSPSLNKSSSSRNSKGYNRNHGLGLNFDQQPNNMDNIENRRNQNQNLSSLRNRNDQIYIMPLENSNTITRQNSMKSRLLNDKLLNDLPYKNNWNDKTTEDRNIGKRQKSITSDIQDFQNFPSFQNTFHPLIRRLTQQNTLFPSNDDDSQQRDVGNDDSSKMNLMNFITKPLSNHGLNSHHNIAFISVNQCCIHGVCRTLKHGDECNIYNFENIKNKQQPNNPMSITPNNGDNGFNNIMSKFMNKNFNLFDQNSPNSSEGDMGDFKETGRPTNKLMDSMRYSTINPSISSTNGMSPYMVMPEKKTPINYPYSDPINVNENEVNKIRNQVLQRSNFYRKKYNLELLTLDDQLNNCAQDWANEMARSNIFDHRDDNAYGENLFTSSDPKNLGSEAVNSWYNEILQFNVNGDENELSSNVPTFHMTQLLWKPSTKLGVGVSKNSSGMYNVVANYDPAGNVIGHFKENLPEIKHEDINEVN